MHVLSSALLVLASVQAACAVRLPYAPESSLQDRQMAREAVERRQARKGDVVRRLRNGPAKRQPSPLVCADTIGQNKLSNSGFDTYNVAPWSLTFTGETFGGVFDNTGYNGKGLLVTTPVGTATLTQSITVCGAGTSYTLSFNSGLFQSTATRDSGQCSLAVSVAGTPLAAVTPCTSAQPCTLVSDNGQNEFRFDSAIYTPTTAGTVEVKVVFTCGQGQTYETLLDNVQISRSS